MAPLEDGEQQRALTPVEELQLRLAAVAELQVFTSTYAGRLGKLAEEAAAPLALPVFLRTLSHDLLQAWGSHRFCFLAVAVYCAVAFGALSGVLAKVASDGACSALITGGLVSLNFTTEVPLCAWNTNEGPPVALLTGTPLTITLVNNYPLGSVEVVNEELKLAAGDFQGSNIARVEVLYFWRGKRRTVPPTPPPRRWPARSWRTWAPGRWAAFYAPSVVLNPPAQAAQ